ncbi:hypothetical protein ABZ820_24620 [Streptomyces diacarni]|uniref:hypothetical protein n=1 Tax=Streptomyces diacarni TaxID=2800381 RepID=UPI0033C2C01F
MELTYQDIMEADFGTLTTAAKKWRSMGKSFATLRTQYDTNVSKKLSSWHGKASGAYYLSEASTLANLDAAKEQATAFARLLDDGREMLDNARNALKEARKAAMEEGGMKIDEYGKCTTDTSGMTSGEASSKLRDPGRADLETYWNQVIKRGVQTVQEADTLIMMALKAVAGDESTLKGTVSFNADAPSNMGAFMKDLAEEQAKKDAEPHVSPKLAKAIIHGVNTAIHTPGGMGKKAVVGTIDGLSEATGYNNTQGLCLNASAGMGANIGVEGCLLVTRKPDGGAQISVVDSVTTSTAGWSFGTDVNVSVMKSNADDIDQIRGPSWNAGVSGHVGPIGGEVNHGKALNVKNSEGDSVYSESVGFGPGIEAGGSTGFGNSYGTVLWESPEATKK